MGGGGGSEINDIEGIAEIPFDRTKLLPPTLYARNANNLLLISHESTRKFAALKSQFPLFIFLVIPAHCADTSHTPRAEAERNQHEQAEIVIYFIICR
jgi:hypothetical protein